MDPGVGLGLERVVALAIRPDPLDLLVHLADARRPSPRRGRARRRSSRRSSRAFAAAGPRGRTKVRVLADPGADGRMRDLQQDRVGAGADQAGIARVAPDRRPGFATSSDLVGIGRRAACGDGTQTNTSSSPVSPVAILSAMADRLFDSGEERRQPGRRRAAGGADAAAVARRAGRAGARAGRGIGAADRDRERASAQRDPLRAARLGEDDAGADRGGGRGRRLRGGVGGQRRQGRDQGR